MRPNNSGDVSPNPRFFPKADFRSFSAPTFRISLQKRKAASAGSRSDAGFTPPTGACQASKTGKFPAGGNFWGLGLDPHSGDDTFAKAPKPRCLRGDGLAFQTRLVRRGNPLRALIGKTVRNRTLTRHRHAFFSVRVPQKNSCVFLTA
jgi:hypothetical protein